MIAVEVRGDAPDQVGLVLPLLVPGGIVLVSGLPAAGKTTIATEAATRAGAVLVTLAPGHRSNPHTLAARVVAALSAAAAGRAVLVDVCAATALTPSYWTSRLPLCAIVRVEAAEGIRQARLTAQRRAARA